MSSAVMLLAAGCKYKVELRNSVADDLIKY